MESAFSTSSERRWVSIAQPTTKRIQASRTTATYNQPAWVRTYVRSATQS